MRRGARAFSLALSLGALAVALLASSATAQQIYRWTDRDGRVHVTDTPPPPGAKEVESARTKPAAAPAQQVPFEVQRLQQLYPVTLYTSPGCKEPCAMAREALGKRGVPFKEVQVWDDATNEELKRVSGSNEVPTLTVGRTVQKGFQQDAFDVLLDSAGYPKEGILPTRSAAAPAVPEGYPQSEPEAQKAEPVQPGAQEAPAATGPYSPGARRQTRGR